MTTVEAKRYDRGLWLLERLTLNRLRRDLLKNVRGDVLEIGAGTGANLPFYRQATRITAVDNHIGRLTGTATRRSPKPVNVSCANAHNLPFASNCFDAVVGTLVFCSIADPGVALSEILRVLRAGGYLYLLEHVRGQGPVSRLLTDCLHPLWFAIQGECHLNRETAISVQNAGFEITNISHHGWGILQVIHARRQ